jgi:hypothetical protein
MKTNQSEPSIMAQSSSPSPVLVQQQIASNFPLWPIVLTAMITIGLTLFVVKLLPRSYHFAKAKDQGKRIKIEGQTMPHPAIGAG